MLKSEWPRDRESLFQAVVGEPVATRAAWQNARQTNFNSRQPNQKITPHPLIVRREPKVSCFRRNGVLPYILACRSHVQIYSFLPDQSNRPSSAASFGEGR